MMEVSSPTVEAATGFSPSYTRVAGKALARLPLTAPRSTFLLGPRAGAFESRQVRSCAGCVSDQFVRLVDQRGASQTNRLGDGFLGD
jgi:hypothetical protein